MGKHQKTITPERANLLSEEILDSPFVAARWLTMFNAVRITNLKEEANQNAIKTQELNGELIIDFMKESVDEVQEFLEKEKNDKFFSLK